MSLTSREQRLVEVSSMILLGLQNGAIWQTMTKELALALQPYYDPSTEEYNVRTGNEPT